MQREKRNQRIILQCHEIVMCMNPKSLTEMGKDTSLLTKYRRNIFTAHTALCNGKKTICLSDSTRAFAKKEWWTNALSALQEHTEANTPDISSFSIQSSDCFEQESLVLWQPAGSERDLKLFSQRMLLCDILLLFRQPLLYETLNARWCCGTGKSATHLRSYNIQTVLIMFTSFSWTQF